MNTNPLIAKAKEILVKEELKAQVIVSKTALDLLTESLTQKQIIKLQNLAALTGKDLKTYIETYK